jgi:hypothetical protein
MWVFESQPMFRRNLSSTFLRLKSKLSKKRAWSKSEANFACCLFHADLLLDLPFNSEDRGNVFYLDVSCFQQIIGLLSQQTERFKYVFRLMER